MLSARLELTAPFHDVDSMHVVWHGHYVKYFELVRCQLLESFHYDYSEMFESGYAWPVVDLRVKYVKPIRFNQKIIALATMTEWEYRLKIIYRIIDAVDHTTLTKGQTTQVALCMKTNEMCFETPDIFRKKLGVSF